MEDYMKSDYFIIAACSITYILLCNVDSLTGFFTQVRPDVVSLENASSSCNT